MGQTDIRKLLIIGAMSRIRWIVRKGVLCGKDFNVQDGENQSRGLEHKAL